MKQSRTTRQGHNLSFDDTDGKHEYVVDGVPVPSVTQVLKGVGIVQNWGTEADMQRGSFVHKAIHLLVESKLDMDSLDSLLKPYVAGFLMFLSETGFKVELSEHIVYNRKMGYAGTLDLYGRTRHPTPWLIDIKTGQYGYAAALQLLGYKTALIDELGDVEEATCMRVLQLKGGAYSLSAPLSPDSFTIESVKRVYDIKRKMRLL